MTPNLAANLKKNIPHIERGTAKPGDQISTRFLGPFSHVWHFTVSLGIENGGRLALFPECRQVVNLLRRVSKRCR